MLRQQDEQNEEAELTDPVLLNIKNTKVYNKSQENGGCENIIRDIYSG